MNKGYLSIIGLKIFSGALAVTAGLLTLESLIENIPSAKYVNLLLTTFNTGFYIALDSVQKHYLAEMP